MYVHSVAPVQNNLFARVQICLLSRDHSCMRMAVEKPDKRLHLWISTGLSLIFQVDGELLKVAGGQKKSGETAVGCC